MFGDVYSTFTLAGSYANAVRAAQESDIKAWRERPEKPQKHDAPQKRQFFLKRLIARIGTWVYAPFDKIGLFHTHKSKQ